MTEKDAIREVDDALAELRALDAARARTHDRLKTAVRRAHELGYPKTELARRTGYHRNSIDTWCTSDG